MNYSLKVFTGKVRLIQLPFISLLALLLFHPHSFAQHTMHNMGNDGDTHVMTMPESDAVLASAPETLVLHFESEVRLVKLVLRESGAGSNFTDIGFRYRPLTSMQFEQSLPALAEADYYTAEWAALDADDRLIRGSFSFSFGANARPPSSYQMPMEHQMEIISPDYRLQ